MTASVQVINTSHVYVLKFKLDLNKTKNIIESCDDMGLQQVQLPAFTILVSLFINSIEFCRESAVVTLDLVRSVI